MSPNQAGLSLLTLTSHSIFICDVEEKGEIEGHTSLFTSLNFQSRPWKRFPLPEPFPIMCHAYYEVQENGSLSFVRIR